MALGDTILDTIAGAGGHVINRPALSAAVMQGQAMAGLRTAQTEDALLNAQKLREEMDAGDQLEGAYTFLGLGGGSGDVPEVEAVTHEEGCGGERPRSQEGIGNGYRRVLGPGCDGCCVRRGTVQEPTGCHYAAE